MKKIEYKIEYKVVPLAIALAALGCSREPQEHKVSVELKQPADPQPTGMSKVTVDAKEPADPHAAGSSSDQLKAAAEDLRIASEKMDQLLADAAKLPRGNPRNKANMFLSDVQRNYSNMAQMERNYEQATPGYAAKWYRNKVEGKTIYDFAGPEARPENIAAKAAAADAIKAAADAVNKEKIRLYESVDTARLPQYQAVQTGLHAESRMRFPHDELARMNWWLDQVRGRSVEDLAAVQESARTAAERAESAEKQIDLAEAISAIKANEAKVKNAQWHIVYSAGALERSRDVSSYKPLPLTRTEANVLYDYETDRYRVELSGVREWPKGDGPQPTPLLEWKHLYAYDGTELRVLRFDGPPTLNSPQAYIARDAESFEGRNELVHAVTTQAGGMYFLNGSPYEVEAVPLPRLSKQLEMNSKEAGQIKVNARDNGVWVIADWGVPFRLAYDPRKGSSLGAQFVTLYPMAIVNPTQRTNADPNEPKTANPGEGIKANENERPKSPTELTGVLKIELQQVGEFWAPKIVTRANFLDAGAAQRFEFSDVKINQPLSPAAFTIEFQPGTHVVDRVAKKAYMVADPAAQP